MGFDPNVMRAAERALSLSDWGSARNLLLKIIETIDHPDALIHLSYLESKEGNYRLARDYALRAARRSPRQPKTIARLLTRLRNFNESGALHDFVDRSPFLRDLDPQTLQIVSAQLSYIGLQEEAEMYLEKAIAKFSGSPHLHLARAQVRIFLGRFDAAELDLQRCLKLAPTMANAWWTLAGVRKQTPDSNHVDRLRGMIAAGPKTAAEQAYLSYGLHKELDDLGDFEAAAQALEVACKARRTEQEYSAEQTRDLFARIKALPTDKASEAEAEFTPVFIVGMYRSGTTLLERLIGANPGVLNAGELQDMTGCMRQATDHHCFGVTDMTVVSRAADADYTAIGRQYLDGVRWRLDGHTHITDKWPPNHVNVGFICQALPKARVIHMVRDPVETCFSNLREMFSGAAPYSYDQRELASYCNEYNLLMRHWQERFPGRMLEVSYSRLTTDTEAVMREVADFSGIGFMPEMLDPRSAKRGVATASAIQVRNAVTSRKTAKWEPYRSYLAPLIEALEEPSIA